MVADGAVQTTCEHLQNRIVQGGIELWNRQKEAARLKKLQEQKEMRDLLENYWPWSTENERPRGLKNLRLEGLFPNKDYLKAKRMVDPILLRRTGAGGGGGAPIISRSGKKMAKTKEDPMLRFQWSKDLRQTVDNTLRYKTGQEEMQKYKQQLDVQVAERKLKEEMEKHSDLLHFQRSGWSTEKTLKVLEKERQRYKDMINKQYTDFRDVTLHPPDTVSKHNKVLTPTKYREDRENEPPCPHQTRTSSPERRHNFSGKVRLAPLNEAKVNGEELVPLMAKPRAFPQKIPLGTTDVTRGTPEKKKSPLPSYLLDLTNQMKYARQRIKEMKVDDMEMSRQHFSTLDAYWGRPGHGAPRPIIKKGCLDRLLYGHRLTAH